MVIYWKTWKYEAYLLYFKDEINTMQESSGIVVRKEWWIRLCHILAVRDHIMDNHSTHHQQLLVIAWTKRSKPHKLLLNTIWAVLHLHTIFSILRILLWINCFSTFSMLAYGLETLRLWERLTFIETPTKKSNKNKYKYSYHRDPYPMAQVKLKTKYQFDPHPTSAI